MSHPDSSDSASPDAPRGRFITFEGVDGAGKSTLIALVVTELRAQGRQVLVTREPGGTALGEALRNLLLDNVMDSLTETLLMYAARREHLKQVIRPALRSGSWVLSDRYADASHAYQGGGRGVDARVLQALDGFVLDGVQPDLTVLVDISPEEAQQRRERARNADRFELESLAFFERVRAAYLARAKANAERFLVVHGNRRPEELAATIVAGLKDWE